MAGPVSVIRVDPAPGFNALREDGLLLRHHIAVEVGRIKNRNKNPVAERAVQEFVDELAKSQPTGYISPLTVTLLCNQLNQKIRYPGISSKEMLTKRDQFTNFQLPIDDVDLIMQKHQQHLQNHHPSALSKSSKPALSEVPINVGDLVYLVDDPISKGKHRERYIVASVDDQWCNVRKFTETQLRSMTYRVKKNRCYPVPCYQHPCTPNNDSIQDIASEDLQPCETEKVITPEVRFENHSPDTMPHTPIPEALEEVVTPEIDTFPTPEQTLPLSDSIEPITPDPEPPDSLRRSGRERNPPPYLKDYSH